MHRLLTLNSWLNAKNLILLPLLLLNFTLNALAFQSDGCDPLESQILMNTTVEWQSPPCGFSTSDQFTPLVHFNNATYFVWVDASFRPWLTQVVNGNATIAPLDPGTDYTAQPDGHHRFSLGVDKNGYIHVTGDMHNYNYNTTGVINPYPVRYQKQTILYWKSNQPENISNGFTFVGGLNAPTAIPGSGWTYSSFFTDNYGELYHSALMHAIEGSNSPGEMGVGLYHYNTATHTWAALGGLADNIRQGVYNKILFWENSGQAPSQWFQGFQPCFRFDTANRLHFTVAVNTDITIPGSNRVIYAFSNNGGNTWQKANGQTIPALPIRAIDGNPNQGDVVATTPASGPYFGDAIGVICDKNGTPGVSISNNVTYNNDWYVWNGSKWSLNTNLNFPDVSRGSYGYLDTNQNLVLTVPIASKILRAETFSSPTYGYDLTYNQYSGLNQYALLQTGTIYGVGLNTTTNTQSILKTTMTPSPLPCGWSNLDIAPNPPSYRSSASYVNNTFSLTNYGSAIDNPRDSFQFTYKKLSGDGFIIAHVGTSLASAQGYSRAGVMIREELSADSKEASMILAPGTNNKGAVFGYRAQKGAYTINLNTVDSTITNPYWVKLTRQGPYFTGYISADGLTWRQMGAVTITMANDIFIGLAASSYANGYYMQTATFDNVIAPWAGNPTSGQCIN